MTGPPRRSTLFPSTPLFRSRRGLRRPAAAPARAPPGRRAARAPRRPPPRPDSLGTARVGAEADEAVALAQLLPARGVGAQRSGEDTSELQSRPYLVCPLFF